MMQLMTCYQTWKMNEDFAKATGADLTLMNLFLMVISKARQ